MMEPWRRVWRVGLVPQLSTPGLEALGRALAEDSPELAQEMTCRPPPMLESVASPVEAACAVSYAAWKGDGLNTVGELEEHFGRACLVAEGLLGEPAGCRWFLNWFDDTPRAEVFPLLLGEVRRALAARGAGGDG